MFPASQHALASGEIQISLDFLRIIAVTAETFFFQEWVYFQGKDLVDVGMGLVLISSVEIKIPAGRGDGPDYERFDMRSQPRLNTPLNEVGLASRRCDMRLDV